jgi:uncharacterized membrane protein
MAFCGNCGTQTADGVKFCPSCGKEIGAAPAQQAPPVQPQQQYQQAATPQNDAEANKMMAILSYILFFIPLLTGAHKTSPFVKYHANQGTVLFLLALAWGIVNGILTAILGAILINPATWYSGSWGAYGLITTILGLIWLIPTALCNYTIDTILDDLPEEDLLEIPESSESEDVPDDMTMASSEDSSEEAIVEQSLVNDPDAQEIAVAQEVSLNGAQISGLLSILDSYNSGALTRESAIQVIMASYPFDRQKARQKAEGLVGEEQTDGTVCTDAEEECRAKDPSKCPVHGNSRGTSDGEKQKKIDSIVISPDGDTELPRLNFETLEKYGIEDRPVLLKKGIAEKNMRSHPDVSPSEFREIIGNALYRPDVVLAAHDEKPYFNFISRTGENKSAISLLQVADTGTGSLEIVNMHWIGDDGRKRKEQAAEKRK